MVRNTFTVTAMARSRPRSVTVVASHSEEAALRAAHELYVPAPARLDVGLHVGCKVVDMGTYTWDGTDTAFVGRGSRVEDSPVQCRVVSVEMVEYEEGEFFGHVVARTDVRGMTEEERAAEVEEMKALVGDHCVAVEVEEFAGVR